MVCPPAPLIVHGRSYWGRDLLLAVIDCAAAPVDRDFVRYDWDGDKRKRFM